MTFVDFVEGTKSQKASKVWLVFTNSAGTLPATGDSLSGGK